MSVTREMLLKELKELQRLTAFEQAVATVRRTQAATTPISQELGANARKAGERLALLGSAVRRVGGSPDLVSPVLGRLGAFVQTQVNQVQTLQGALLGDLALEHQLRDRARYARTLAVTLGETGVLPVLDRLELAHSETITWLERRLGEVGRTGTSALRATPVQAVVGSVRSAVGVPFALAATGVNRVAGLVTRAGRQVPAAVGQVQETVGQVQETVQDRAGQAAEAVTDRVVDVTDRATEQAATAATAVTAATAATEQASVPDPTDVSDVAEDKPPFAGYERLSGDSIMRHVQDTEDVEELRVLLSFEEAHKARKGVLATVRDRLTELESRVQQAQE
jgi:hypothetical protein